MPESQYAASPLDRLLQRLRHVAHRVGKRRLLAFSALVGAATAWGVFTVASSADSTAYVPSVLVGVAVAGGILSITGNSSSAAFAPSDLPEIEARVRKEHADVAQLVPQALTDVNRHTAPLIVDVRAPEEFAVSHIAGAVRVDPGISTKAFLEKLAASAAGRDVVFYCSVGMRSSPLAARVADALKQAGAGGVYNLEGGLFRWHNEKRALVDRKGPTDRIHPYDNHWGGLIARQDQIAVAPR